MSRVIAITSGKGGVGKTTAAANLGVGLGMAGKRVVLLDMDLGLRNLDVSLGLETQVFYHLGDVLSGSCRLEQALVTSPLYPNLFLLAAAQNSGADCVSQEALVRLLVELDKKCDIVLIDCPAGIGENFRRAMQVADEGIVVTNPVVSAVRDADKVLHLMEDAGIHNRCVLVNAIRYELIKRGAMMLPEDITDVLGVNLIGAVPDDDAVIEYSNAGRTLIGTNTAAGKAFERISRRIVGETVPIPPLKKSRKGLFRR